MDIEEKTLLEVEKLFASVNICKSHNIEHIKRVKTHTKNALEHNKNISEKLKTLVIIAAILHDNDDKKYFNTTNYENARNICKLLNLNADDTDLVIMMIKYVSCSENSNNIPEEAIQMPWILYPRYSDIIDAVDLYGILRAHQYAVTKGDPLFTDNTPKVNSVDEIWEIATEARFKNYKGKSVSMIDHYYDKLLFLTKTKCDNEYFNKEFSKCQNIMYDIILAFSAGKLDNDYIYNKYGKL
jgi:uncharacterized protein